MEKNHTRKSGTQLENTCKKNKNLTITVSRSHLDKKTIQFISSLKYKKKKQLDHPLNFA